MIDTIFRLETPEAIDLSISPAGPVARGLALAIDFAIRIGVLAVVGLTVSSLGEFGGGLFLVLFFTTEWFFPVFFEVLFNGQTPGKLSLGLRVVNSDGTPIGWSASILRNLLRVADLLPFFYVAGVVSILSSDKMQRLGDLAAGTLVVNVRQAKLSHAPPHRVGAKPARIALHADEQRAILSFAERSAELSDARALELAMLLQPLTGAVPDAAAEELFRIANGLAGRE